MRKKIVGILICVLMLVSSFISISSAKKESSRIISNIKQVGENKNDAPVINYVKYLKSERMFGRFWGKYLCYMQISYYDPDGDEVGIGYKRYESDSWRFIGSFPSNYTFVITWDVEKGSYTAYFKAFDGLLESDIVTESYSVPKTKLKISGFSFFEELFNMPLFIRLFKQ